MVISRQSRTPEYFGAVSRAQKQSIDTNPYFSGKPDMPADPRSKRRINGYLKGKIEDGQH